LANTVFTVQMDGAGISDIKIGHANFYDILATTGSTVTKQSNHQLDADQTTSKTLEILGLVDKPGNAWGIYGDVYVMFHVDERLQIAGVAAP
jgi:hypothetical protein